MSWYTHPSPKFARVAGTIQPVCKSEAVIPGGTIIFYEKPIKSTGDFHLDIIRYTMQCIYGGECVFPLAFKQEINNHEDEESVKWRVFFYHAFTTCFPRRQVADKLALALLAQSVQPYLFKALGIFQVDSDTCNCHRVSLLDGEIYLVTSKEITGSEIIKLSEGQCLVPGLSDNQYRQMEAMNNTDLDNLPRFIEALESRERASKKRPGGKVTEINSSLDPGLEDRILKYRREKHMGLTAICEGVHRLAGKDQEQDCLLKMEEMFGELLTKVE